MSDIMKLRPYDPSLDFGIIRKWITEPREHAMWCAGRTAFPIDREDFQRLLDEIANQSGDVPFIATLEGCKPVGFFCYSVDAWTKDSRLKFVMIDPALRGKGFGREMLRLAVSYAFETMGAKRVRLCVFSANTGARRCYESVGFRECCTDKAALHFGDEVWDRCHMAIERR